jgi:hypothetical protein
LDGGETHFTLIRCKTDGTLDPSFGSGGITTTTFLNYGYVNEAATSLALQADGKVVVTGTANGYFAVSRYDAAFSTIQISKIANLLILFGSKNDDQIDITADAHGVTVASLREDTPPLTIPGIDQVMVETGEGDDTLSVRLQPDPNHEFRFEADLGSGDDVFNTVLVQPGPCMPGERPGTLGLAVRGGSGNDTFNTVLVQPGPCMPVQVSLDGGAGDDHFTTAFLGSDSPSSEDGDLPSPVDLNVQGGDGHDDIRVIFGFNPQPDPPALPSVFLNMPVHAQLDGGRGDDDIRVIYGFNPQPDPPAKLFINAPMDITVAGGLGNDDIRVIYGFNPQPDPPAIPSVVLNAPVNLTLDGGAGNDFLLGEFQSLAFRGGLLNATLDGGSGDDMVAAFLTLLDGTWGDGSRIAVLGGSGDDVLALQTLGVPSTTRGDLFVDGGSGFDIALVSAGVDVMDCEVVLSPGR